MVQVLLAISSVVILFELMLFLHCKLVPCLPDVLLQKLISCQPFHRVRRSFQGLHSASGAWTSSRNSPQQRATRISLPWEAQLGVRGAQSLQEPGAKAQASLLVGPPVIVLYLSVHSCIILHLKNVSFHEFCLKHVRLPACPCTSVSN